METEQRKRALWKTYGILMGIMLGGSVVVLGGQGIWSSIQAEQARKASLEEENYGKYTQIFQKITSRSSITPPNTTRDSEIEKAKQYCSSIDAGKSNPQKDWGSASASKSPKFSLQQALILSQIQVYCPQHVSKLPKDYQDKLSALDNITKEEAIDVINRWQEAKSRIFASPFDRELAASLATGQVLEDIIKSDGSIDWLQRNNSYYTYGSYKVEPTKYFKSGSSQAEIEAKVTQEITFYSNGRPQSKPDSSVYRYSLALENGVWKIANRKEMQ
jgi:hypothetical protein